MTPAEARRRNAAIETMRRQAADLGFVLGEVHQVEQGATVRLFSSMPGGREITASYEKPNEPTA